MKFQRETQQKLVQARGTPSFSTPPGPTYNYQQMRMRCCSEITRLRGTLSLIAVTLVLFVASTRAHAQVEGNPVYLNDSPRAAAILRDLPNMVRVGNQTEAVRSLQTLLTQEPDRVINTMGWAEPHAGTARSMVDPQRWLNEDKDLFVSVRSQVHAALLASPELLDRYRRTYEPEAKAALERGEHEQVEAHYLLTSSGFVAALRIAQDQIEHAHFGSAYRTLCQLEHHPEMQDDAMRTRAASIAINLVSWSASQDAVALAGRWSSGIAGMQVPVSPNTWPDRARLQQIDLLNSASDLVPENNRQTVATQIPDEPLNTIALDWPERVSNTSTLSPPELRDESGNVISNTLWVFPSVWNDLLIINDGVWIRALDRYTLEPVWHTMPQMTPGAQGIDSEQSKAWRIRLEMTAGKDMADPTTVSITDGVVVATTGLADPSSNNRNGDPRVHGFKAETGEVMWSVNVQSLDPTLANTTIRGPVAIDDGIAVVTLISSGQSTRVKSRYLVGLDLWTGAFRWSRLVGIEGWVPWQPEQRERVVNASIATDGCVFTTDKLGVIAAYEISNGRPLWVRQFDTPAQVTLMPRRVWEIMTPVVANNTLFSVSPDRSALLAINATTGRIDAQRPASTLGNPAYLVRVGEYIGGLGAYGVGFLPIESFASARPKLIEMRELLGRAVPVQRETGSTSVWSLLSPTMDGYTFIPPDAPTKQDIVQLDRAGQVLAMPDQVLACDGRAVHTYLTWSRANHLLRARMESSENDPRPALSFAKFAFMLGEYQDVLQALDTALRAVESKEGTELVDARARTHTSMMELLTLGVERISRSPQNKIVKAPTADLLDEVGTRIERLTTTDIERVHTAFAMGKLHEVAHRPDLALRRYHDILANQLLASQMYSANGRTRDAASIATDRIRSIAAEFGRTAYAQFDAEAEIAWERAQNSGDVASYERTAVMYPGAEITPLVWRMVAQFWRDQPDPLSSAKTISSLRCALDAAEANMRIDATDSTRAVEDLYLGSQQLAEAFASQSRYATALSLLHRIEQTYPSIRSANPDAPSFASFAADLKSRLGASTRRARIGTQFSPHAQSISSWIHMKPVLREFGDLATEHVMLMSRTERRIGLFGATTSAVQSSAGIDPLSEPLQPIWFRDLNEIEPDLLRCDQECVYLTWPTSAGYVFECIDAITGETRWRTDPFRSLFPRDDAFAQMLIDDRGAPRIVDIPNVGMRQLQEVVVSMSDSQLAAVERSGRIVVFDLATGRETMKQVSSIRVVQDADILDGVLTVIGREKTPQPVDRGGLPESSQSVALVYDTATQQQLVEFRTILGPAHWCRVLSRDRIIVASTLEVVALTTADRSGKAPVAWRLQHDVSEQAVDAWAYAGSVALFLENESLRVVNAADGTVLNENVRTDDRIGLSSRTRAIEVNGNLVISSSKGVIVIDSHGDTVGIDSLGTSPALLPGEVASDVLVSAVRTPSVYVNGTGRYQLYVFSTGDASLLATQDIVLPQAPSYLSLLDGCIVMTSGGSTHVVFTTADASSPE